MFPSITKLTAKLTAPQLIPPMGPPGFIIPFDTVISDDHGCWDPLNPTTITAPDGATMVTIASYFEIAAAPFPIQAEIHPFRKGAPTADCFLHRKSGSSLSGVILEGGTGGVPQPIIHGESWSFRIWNLSQGPIKGLMGLGCWCAFKWE